MTTSLGVVDGATWSKNSVFSATGGEVQLTSGANDIGNLIYSSTPLTVLEGVLHFKMQWPGGIPELMDTWFGFIAGSGNVSAATSLGAESTFCGLNFHCANNPYNTRVVVNGVVSGTTAGYAVGRNDNTAAATYYDWYLVITYTLGNVNFKVYRDSVTSANLRASLSMTAPAGLTSIRPAFGHNTAFGFTTDAWMTGTPDWETDPNNFPAISNVNAFSYNAGASISWNPAMLASSYDYRLNGGSVTNILATDSPMLNLSGLTNGTTYTLEIRPVTTGGSGAWVSTTLTPHLPVTFNIFDNFERTAVTPSSSALGTSTDGHTWTQPTGTLGIDATGYAYANAGGENLAIFPAGAYNQDISMVDIHGPTNVSHGLIFRYRDTSNYYLFNADSDNWYRLYRKISGSFNQLFIWQGTGGWKQGDTFRVWCLGRDVVLYRNGAKILYFEDTFGVTATDTGVGFRLDSNGSKIGAFSAGDSTAFSTGTGGVRDVVPDGIKATPPTPSPSWVYKGRDTKILDTVGAS